MNMVQEMFLPGYPMLVFQQGSLLKQCHEIDQRNLVRCCQSLADLLDGLRSAEWTDILIAGTFGSFQGLRCLLLLQ